MAASWDASQIPDQSGKRAIVTGANSGIGLEAARELLRRGAHVTLACRSPERAATALEELRTSLGDEAAGRADIAELDLSSLESVHSFARQFAQSSAPLDLLCNNAGVMIPPYGKTKEGFELQIGTNHLGHFALTGLLLPRVLTAPAGRIVTVSSTAHRFGSIQFDDLHWERSYNKFFAYGQSKLANLLFSFELERKLRAAGCAAISNACHPGYASTHLQQHAWYVEMLNPIFSQDAAAGALPTLYAATAENATGGEYYGPSRMFEMHGPPQRATIASAAQDLATAERLWQLSEELTDVRFEVTA